MKSCAAPDKNLMVAKKDKPNIYGLVGRNISYSLSPAMHNAAIKHYGISGEYRLFDIDEDALNDFLLGAISDGVVKGVNVTVPYKIKAMDLLMSLKGVKVLIDDDAKILGAVNTVKIGKDKVEAYNTDGKGFCASLREDAGFDPSGKSIFVIGSGGAARAISIALALLGKKGPRAIYVYDVDDEQVRSLGGIFKKHFGGKIFSPVKKSSLNKALETCDLAVNATPLGTKEGDSAPFSVEYLKKGAVVYDLVYARETELVKAAKKRSLTAVSGLGMLVNQGAVAFHIWTGKPLKETVKIMRKAAEGSREKR